MSNTAEPPKRPLTAYFLFLADVRGDLFKTHPKTSVADITRLAGYPNPNRFIRERWRTIDPKTKSGYQRRANEIREKYELDRQVYEEEHGPIKRKRRTKKEKGTRRKRSAS
jgi:hypothetical protein